MRAGDIQKFVAHNPETAAHFIPGDAQLGIWLLGVEREDAPQVAKGVKARVAGLSAAAL